MKFLWKCFFLFPQTFPPWTILGQCTRPSQIVHDLPHPSTLSTRRRRGGINGILCKFSSRYNNYSLKCPAFPLEENKFRILKCKISNCEKIFLAYVTPRVPQFGTTIWLAIANIYKKYKHEQRALLYSLLILNALCPRQKIIKL